MCHNNSRHNKFQPKRKLEVMSTLCVCVCMSVCVCVCGCVHMHVCVCLCTKGIPSWVLTRTKVIDKPSLQASYRQAPANSAHFHARSTNVNRISSPGYTRLAPQTCPHKAPKMRLNAQNLFPKNCLDAKFPSLSPLRTSHPLLPHSIKQTYIFFLHLLNHSNSHFLSH